ncbi:LytR/AlgR family response regulator transcription factor [Acanthopleuribacter pedis]|uniref:Response regulator transcription factor n=1 Tax=Acanthopleuribacter pedis TaxID=442870 RepID=A0A8J7QAV1_9BACT|nr:LytTR family DNA-binding domain-containing protein [Acanthopleuribacter pedis]MBO1322096.1 response regulator transcription factor [Acanthopleuribacter pedis]
MRTLIVDDEQPARNKLRRFLGEDPRFQIIGEAENGLEALEKIEADPPDLVFLDIQMPGLNGFEVLEALPLEKPPKFVFATAYDQYAVRAFEVQAVDYLLKPYDRARFQQTLAAVLSRDSDERAHLDKLLRHLAPQGGALKRLLIRQGKRLIPLTMAEVSHIQAEEKYVRLFHGGQSYLHREPISALEQKLDPTVFLRVHRGDIVNLGFIQTLEPWTKGAYRITLSDGKQITLSKSYRDTFFNAFGSR